MIRTKVLLTVVLGVGLAGGGCGDDGGRSTEAAVGAPGAPEDTARINPVDFSPVITNPLLPLSLVRTSDYAGHDRRADGGKVETRVERRLLDKTDTFAGVTVAVLEVKEYENGQLTELTEDYFAQHRDGAVWYFGERVTNYQDGKVRDHDGQWLAGEGGAVPGVLMPANPAVGQEFQPEQVAGVAEERSKVVALGIELTVPAGTFTGCVEIEDLDIRDNERESKFYCPGKGLVRETGSSGGIDLIRFA